MNIKRAKSSEEGGQKANPEKIVERRRANSERVAKWQKTHPERMAVANKKCYQANPEKAKTRAKNWQEANPEKVVAARKKWEGSNPEKLKKYSKKYYQENKEKIIVKSKKWNKANREKQSEYNNNKRFKRRAWGKPTYLNVPFKDSVSHHLEKQIIIHIPETLHQSVWHDLEKGTNMLKINGLAMAWFEGLV